MWPQFATLTNSLSQIALIVTAAAAAIGIFVTFIKLKPDMTSANIAQTRDALSAQAQFTQQIMQDRDSWRTRAIESETSCERYRKDLNDCREELERCRSRHAKPSR